MNLHIAGLTVSLHQSQALGGELRQVYRDFAARGEVYRQNHANPHLCFAGCSHCCRQGAFFAVTLVEAWVWAAAVRELSEALGRRVLEQARELLELQQRTFVDEVEPGDVPGGRDDRSFNARVARVARLGVACPLLERDLCSVYERRPFLCRAYGFPVDAFAIENDDSLTFRSLCHLYDGKALRAYVQARDLKQQLEELSRRLAGGVELGRFTSAEAILARVE